MAVPHESKTPLRRCLIGALLAWAVVGPASAALWYESYEQAEQAMQDENWPEAVRLLTEALESKGDSSARARTYGMNFVAYFPYFKLGVSYYRIGQTDAALQAFETEERFGVIAESNSDYAELQRVRGLIEQEREAAAAEEQQRIQGIIADSLSKAQRLEDAGQFEEALGELANALAIEQDHAEATSARQRLLGKITRQQREQELTGQVARLVEQGRGELSSNRYGEAASFFRRALDLKSNDEVQALFDEAQGRLRAQIEVEQTAQQRTASIAQGLKEAESLETEGKLPQALDRLQFVLALDPENRRALTGQTRLIRAQAAADRDSLQIQTIRDLLSEAQVHLDSGKFGPALTTANRVLTLDPDNSVAKGHIATAYARISEDLLSSVRNEPPYVSPGRDKREPLEGFDEPAELVTQLPLLINGVAADNSSIELTILDHLGHEIPEDQIIKTVMPIGDGVFLTSFSLMHNLPAGFSQLTVVATDEYGASTSYEYAYVYKRPFFRSPWLYAELAVLALGLVGARLVHKARVRLQRLKRRFNPYIAGAPVMQQDLFFGRERLINHVLGRIHNNSILLYGERRIGKTSIQHQLRSRLRELRDPKYKFYAAYIDLQGTPEERFFSTMADDLFHELGPLLDGLEPCASTSDGVSYDHRAFQRDIRAIIKKLKEKTDKHVKVVLLIDEVDELNNYDPRVNQRLRSLFMKSFAENLVAVVSGVGIKKQWELEGSPWYNFFQEIEVQPFQRKDAVELIEGPIRGVFKLEDGVIDSIIEVTDCKPYLIQRVCAAAVNRVHEEKRRRITVADVKAVAQVAEVM